MRKRLRQHPRRRSRRAERRASRKAPVLFTFALILACSLAVQFIHRAGPERVAVPFSPYFLQQVNAGNVRSISVSGNAISGTFKTKVRYPQTKPAAKPTLLFATEVPPFWNGGEVGALLRSERVEIAPPSKASKSWLLGAVPREIFLFVLLWGGWYVLVRRARDAGGVLRPFGRSRARRVERDEITVTFDDVAGIDDAKGELAEIVDFLRDPDRYSRLGGRMPHGVLMSGSPGTGKTLLARAVAGEAHAAFFSLSGAEFVELFVGVGASRVRDLFRKAREAAPAIVFIDELDAIGRSRHGSVSLSGADDERDQTLDQLLTEMDGFEPAETVVVLAATNRPAVLDSALLRPGRFDRHVTVQPPDRAGRREILAVHTRSIPLADDVDLDAIAASTPGMVGADLANLANEAALLAARRERARVTMADCSDALEKVMLGAPRGIALSAEDRERAAYHEAGHALVGLLTPGTDPVRKVSIIPRGTALGVTVFTPENDRASYSREDLLAKIRVALGGRAAEQLIYGTVSTGAESDIDAVTLIARQMVGRWGMSDAVGPVAMLPADGEGPLLPGAGQIASRTSALVDDEVSRLVRHEQETVIALLESHRGALENLTRALLDADTLDGAEVQALTGAAAATPHAIAVSGG